MSIFSLVPFLPPSRLPSLAPSVLPHFLPACLLPPSIYLSFKHFSFISVFLILPSSLPLTITIPPSDLCTYVSPCLTDYLLSPIFTPLFPSPNPWTTCTPTAFVHTLYTHILHQLTFVWHYTFPLLRRTTQHNTLHTAALDVYVTLHLRRFVKELCTLASPRNRFTLPTFSSTLPLPLSTTFTTRPSSLQYRRPVRNSSN